MKKLFLACVPTLVSLAILFIPTLSMPTTAQAQEDTTILIYSDPRPGHTGSEGERDLAYDFNAANDIGIIPHGWTLDCVQNSGDVDPISTPRDCEDCSPWTLDSAYVASDLREDPGDPNSDLLPHFMCVGNHEAELDLAITIPDQDMIDIRGKFPYPVDPDWNLTPGPKGTLETTYSYDVGDIHVLVINEYWNGADDDACLSNDCLDEVDDPAFDGGYIVNALFEWIKQDLRSSTQPYKIIVGHEPGYPVGRHVGDSLDANPENRDKFFNLLRTERVIAYFTSHTHVYNLTEHDGIFEVNTGVCGAHVGDLNWDNQATFAYAHCGSDGFAIHTVREHPLYGWHPFYIERETKASSDLKTQILVNTAEGAGTVCRYFIDYTETVEPNPFWSGLWWENDFDDSRWNDGELGVGYDTTNGWGWINETIDPDNDPLTENVEVHGVFARIPFTVYDKNAYPYMKLGVDYDDAVTVWLNGTMIYESPTSPTISSTDYWDKVATSGHEASGDGARNPGFETFDVSNYIGSLNEGNNLLVIGNWNRTPDSGDLVAGVKLYLTVNPVSAGDTWKYDDTGTDLSTDWREPSYDDSEWSSGPAELGYGDGDEARVIDYGSDPNNKYPCYYFRHSFDISDASDYESLTLKIIRDDGAVVYLNGVEVFRTNMPPGEITYGTWASSAVGGHDESTWYETRVDASHLVSGTNIMAVEVHQSSGDSSDVSFDLQLTPGPAITLLTPDDGAVLPASPPATFAWEADASYRFKIEFSPTSLFPHAFPTITVPRRSWMPDTSTDTIPGPEWERVWNIIQGMERRNGIVYWRVVGKAGPSTPIDISEIRSLTIE